MCQIKLLDFFFKKVAASTCVNRMGRDVIQGVNEACQISQSVQSEFGQHIRVEP